MIVITAEKIYNIHKKQIKRAMNITNLGGVSSLVEAKKNEFTIHFPEEYDYRFDYPRRDIVIGLLKQRYSELLKKNLPIYNIYNEKNLKGFTTTEVDKKRGTSRMPPLNFRDIK